MNAEKLRDTLGSVIATVIFGGLGWWAFKALPTDPRTAATFNIWAGLLVFVLFAMAVCFFIAIWTNLLAAFDSGGGHGGH
jgi:hypothetical protein